MTDDSKAAEKGLGQAPEADEKAEKEALFGKDVVPAIYILFNQKTNTYGIIGAPGFLDDPARAYYALKCAEKNLDQFYFQKKSLREVLTEGIKEFQGSMNRFNFKRFIRGGRN